MDTPKSLQDHNLDFFGIEKSRKTSLAFSYHLQYIEKEQIVEEAKQNFHKEEELSEIKSIIQHQYADNKNYSSVMTIFAIVNTMVGSVVLLIPVNFQNSGLFSSLLCMIILGIVSYKTCHWVVKVSREDDDLSITIKKYLGKFYFNMYCFASATVNFGVGVVYFLLMNQTLYNTLSIIFYYLKFHNFANSDTFTFSQFSIQWLAIGIICLILPLFHINKMDILVKFGNFGAVSIYAYVFFIIYLFIENIGSGRLQENFHKIDWFTTNVTTILGNFSLAFLIQHVITEIMNTNVNTKNKRKENTKNLRYVYIIVNIIYGSIGLLGALALVGRKSLLINPGNIFDFFKEDPGSLTSLFMGIVILTHLITTYPLFNYISKFQFLNILYPNDPAPKYVQVIFNFLFAAVCLLVQLYNIDPNLVIGLCGTIFGFILLYIIPIQLRINGNEEIQQNLIKSKKRSSIQIPHKFGNLVRTTSQQHMFINTVSDKILEKENEEDQDETTQQNNNLNQNFSIFKSQLQNIQIESNLKESQNLLDIDQNQQNNIQDTINNQKDNNYTNNNKNNKKLNNQTKYGIQISKSYHNIDEVHQNKKQNINNSKEKDNWSSLQKNSENKSQIEMPLLQKDEINYQKLQIKVLENSNQKDQKSNLNLLFHNGKKFKITYILFIIFGIILSLLSLAQIFQIQL